MNKFDKWLEASQSTPPEDDSEMLRPDPTLKPTAPSPHERFCAWCDRRIGMTDEAEGPIIPKDQQRGTHGCCVSCYNKMIQELD